MHEGRGNDMAKKRREKTKRVRKREERVETRRTRKEEQGGARVYRELWLSLANIPPLLGRSSHVSTEEKKLPWSAEGVRGGD